MRNSPTSRKSLVIVMITLIHSASISAQGRIENAEFVLPDCRETANINVAGMADAYPYLSADGLRLYFTTGRNGGSLGRIHLSTRASIADVFGDPVILSKNVEQEFYGATLTADELILCASKSGDLYLSQRSSMQSEFGVPVKIKGQTSEFHFGASISPDGSEIMSIVSGNVTDMIRLYRRTRGGEYENAGLLPAPYQGEPGPGQFSKDGLSFYFTIKVDIMGESAIWRYSRQSVHDMFVDLEKLDVTINAGDKNFQPTVNGDGSIIVFVKSNKNRWEDDDIVLINDPVMGVKAEERFVRIENNQSGELEMRSKVITAAVKAYPNPFQDRIILEVNGDGQGENTVRIFDINGRLIMQEKLASSRMEINLSNLSGGTYMYQVINQRQKMLASGKLVKAK